MLIKANDKIKKIICVVSFSLLIILLIIIIFFTRDSQKINDIKKFISTDTKVLYIVQDVKLNYPVEILDKYSIDYLKINSNELTIFERRKLKKIVDIKFKNDMLVIFSNGVVKDIFLECQSEEGVNNFLQKNNIIPETIVENVQLIMDESQKILDNDYSMIYIPYKNLEDINKQDEIFKDIAQDYSIDYKRIDAYLLSSNQQEKINNLLGLSLVEDQILVLIKNNKMIANIRGIHSKNTYIENLYSTNFIDELENKIDEVDYDIFNELLKNNEKSIIIIGSNKIKDSNEVLNLLNEMIYNYDIKVNYIDVNNEDTDLYKRVKEKLENIGYEAAFALPLVIIAESNKILDFAIGNSKEEYFIDIFIENGVIKGDVING